jgi:hypothetical protein
MRTLVVRYRTHAVIIRSLRAQYVQKGEFYLPAELFEGGPLGVQDRLIFGPVVKLADEVRRRWGKPLRCSSGVRSLAKQQQLRESGAKAATHSPHVIGRCAMDLDVGSAQEVYRLVRIVREAARDLGIPVRIGWKEYLRNNQSFVHIDCAPLLADAALREGLITNRTHHAWKKNGAEW